MGIDEILSDATVIPVLEVQNVVSAAPLARALAAGGLRVVELTLRTDCALDALRAMQDAAPGLIVGMGTVRTERDAIEAAAAGAAFLVSPGATPPLLTALGATGVPALPGVATASEVMTAFDAGFRTMKFFPAEAAGGVPYLKSFAGPFPDIAFSPTGGGGLDRAAEYLALPNVACVGGSWIAPKAAIAAGDFEEIEKTARIAVQTLGAV